MKRFLALLALWLFALLGLELFFLLRIGSMRWLNPESTAFQRSEIVRILKTQGVLPWRQEWVDYSQIAPSLKRAVIASEDGSFAEHSGVDWDALEKAWERNQKAQALAEKRAQQQAQQAAAKAKSKATPTAAANRKPAPTPPTVKIVGGSTITQQLAKNLFLSGERNLVRKGQEFVLTFMLEATLSKPRILEIYLNNVEWGEGVFGAQSAAQHYYRKPAATLNTLEAARLAVMLPRPRYFEQKPRSAFLNAQAGKIAGRMPSVELP